MSELARQAPGLARHLVALSCREARTLHLALSQAAPHTCMPAPTARRRLGALREPEALDACLEATERADAPARRHLRAHLAERFVGATAPVAPIHPTWLDAALTGIPPAMRADARVWLDGRDDATAPDSPARHHLQRWCTSRFPTGPLHLRDAPRAATQHPGHACLLGEDELVELVETLGLHALQVGVSDADTRRTAATTAALPEALRERYLALAPWQAARSLRLRLQAAMLELRRRSGADLGTLTRSLGLRVMALAAGSRFEQEIHFLAVRLPKPWTTSLAADHAVTLRYPLAIAHDARLLFDHVMRRHAGSSR